MNGDEQRGGEQTTRALAREIGRHSVERLNDGLQRILGEASGLSRWLLTMIFVLNAGGFWFCFLFPEAVAARHENGLAILFAAGALAAILAAVVSLVLTMPVAAAMRQAITHWTEVSVSGALSDEALRHAKRVKRVSQLWLGVTALVGLVSLALFVMGAAIASNGFSAVQSAFAPPEESIAQNAVENAAQPLAVAPNATGDEAVNAVQPAASPVVQVRPAPTSTPVRTVSPRPPVARMTPRPTPSAQPPRQPVTTSTPATTLPPVAPAPQPAPAVTP